MDLQSQTNQNLSERLKPYQWRIAIIGGIIIALLFGAYSYSKYLVQQSNDALAKQAQDAQKKIDEIRQKREQNVTAGWKTYTNTQYGFEIKYPEFFREVFENNVSYLQSSRGTINFDSEGDYKVFDNFYGKTEANKISVADLIMYEKQFNTGECKALGVQFKSKKIIQISFISCPGDAEPLVDDNNLQTQILSTFKFTK